MPRGVRGPGRPHLLEDGRPKGKMTPYAFFVQMCRAEHKRKHPDDEVNFGEFSKKCAERWRTMSEKEKKRFNQMSEEDKKRYDVEMANFHPHGVFSSRGTGAGRNAKLTPEMIAHHHQQQQRVQMAQMAQLQMAAAAQAQSELEAKGGGRRRRKKKRIKDPNAPKRCMSAFFWFSQDARASVKQAFPSYAVGDIAKELAKRWGDLTPERKLKYDKLAADDRERYLTDKQTYAAKLQNDQRVAAAALEAEAEAELLSDEEDMEEMLLEEEIESD